MKYGFVFDLDMTLVDSSDVEPLRKPGKWSAAMASLHRIRPFSTTPAPHEVVRQLDSLGYPIAVVTQSPAMYAKAVLENFKIPYDVLVAFHDTSEHKPHPEPIEKALQQLGVPASQAFHVGDHAQDVEASHRAGSFRSGPAGALRTSGR